MTDAFAAQRIDAPITTERNVSLADLLSESGVTTSAGDLSISGCEVGADRPPTYQELVHSVCGNAPNSAASRSTGPIRIRNGIFRIERSTTQDGVDIANGRLMIKDAVVRLAKAKRTMLTVEGSHVGRLACTNTRLIIRNRSAIHGDVVTDWAERCRIEGSTIEGKLIADGNRIDIGPDANISQLKLRLASSQRRGNRGRRAANRGSGAHPSPDHHEGADIPVSDRSPTPTEESGEGTQQLVRIGPGSVLGGLSFDGEHCVLSLLGNARFNGDPEMPGLTVIQLSAAESSMGNASAMADLDAEVSSTQGVILNDLDFLDADDSSF